MIDHISRDKESERRLSYVLHNSLAVIFLSLSSSYRTNLLLTLFSIHAKNSFASFFPSSSTISLSVFSRCYGGYLLEKARTFSLLCKYSRWVRRFAWSDHPITGYYKRTLSRFCLGQSQDQDKLRLRFLSYSVSIGCVC